MEASDTPDQNGAAFCDLVSDDEQLAGGDSHVAGSFGTSVQLATAWLRYREALLVGRGSGQSGPLVAAAFGLAVCSAHAGNMGLATTLQGFVAAADQAGGVVLDRTELRLQGEELAMLRDELGAEKFLLLTERGAALSLQQAVDLALSLTLPADEPSA